MGVEKLVYKNNKHKKQQIMNKNKKLQIAKNTARQILVNLKDKNLFML